MKKTPVAKAKYSFSKSILAVFIASAVLLNFYVYLPVNLKALKAHCAQQPAFVPTRNLFLNERYTGYLKSDGYRTGLLGRFSGAIQIPSIAYDSMRGNETDSTDEWLHRPFLELHKYLRLMYPLVHGKLDVKDINDYSLLFVWKGSNADLKPIMLMAHQDVVPVDASTLNDWKYPPFSGFIDETRIWGRGTSDTKLTLISILEAVESLLQVDFTPARTIFIAFGHDEEISGYNGAKQIVHYMQNSLNLSRNGIEFVLDEGLSLQILKNSQLHPVTGESDFQIALVGVAEKGYIDVNITVIMNEGGHSSVAPSHTGIGILAKVITQIEDTPFQPDLQGNNPIIGQMICVAEHTDLYSSNFHYALKHWEFFKSLLLHEFSKNKVSRISVVTTQAVDVIHGGVKVNALPTFAYAMVNMRIAPHENIDFVSNRVMETIEPVAKSFNMDLTSKISTHSVQGSQGRIEVLFDGLEPSPISRTDTNAYKRLSAIIRRVFGDQVFVAPALMTANTDTKWVWNMTQSIFRFMPFVLDGTENVHTVNENTKIVSLVGMVRFYHELIRGFDE